MKNALISALLLATPVAALAIPTMKPASGAPGAVSVDMSAISGGTYQADPAHTLIGFAISHLGFNDYYGLFGDVTGTLNLNKDNLEASTVSVTVPMSGLTVASADLAEHMRSDDFFSTETYSNVTFQSTDVKMTGATTADITGNLTIKGVTKPVTLITEFTGAGMMPMKEKETVGFEATALVNRSDFGIDYAADMLGDEVALQITAAFEK